MMNRTFLSLVVLCVFCTSAAGAAQRWEKKQAPLMTEWSENIDPDNLFDEYPRPQMVRENWTNLNGVWDFLKSDTSAIGQYDPKAVYDKKILVPFPVESALSGIMDTDYANQNKSYAYRRYFSVSKEMRSKRVLLHFGAVDWRCFVYVNGKEVGSHSGGYDPFWFDITDALKPGARQELVVQVYDPTDAGQPRGKQVMKPANIWYTPSSGIWQTVWLEAVGKSYIKDFTIVPDIDNEVVKVTIDGENVAADAKVRVTVLESGKQVTQKIVDPGKEAVLEVRDPKLWSPDSPFLYDLKFELMAGSAVVDEVDSYFGMRKIALGTLRGKPWMFLNNKPVFQYGPLDQGFWPDGLHTAPSYEALYFDIDKTKELGFNMTRKHIKVEPARWYNYCDKVGLLVWQDIPNANNRDHLKGAEAFEYNNWIRHNFERELTAMINSLKNYPSIVVWVPFNEGGGQFGGQISHTQNVVDLVRELDGTRLINAASGWTDYEIGDIKDRHSYSLPLTFDNTYNKRANVCGETGGYGLPISSHSWGKADNPYASLKSGDDLAKALEQLNRQALAQTSDGMCGLVYTQITDIEGEINGLYTYDRKLSKMDNEQRARFRAGAEKLYKTAAKSIVSTGLQLTNGSRWKYYCGDLNFNVGDGWNTDLDFDDSNWSVGMAGFGKNSPGNAVTRTTWDTGTIYLRKTVTPEKMTQDEINSLKLYMFHDDDVEVYINGVLAFSAKGFSGDYKVFDILPEAKKALRPGEENLIAVKCNQDFGGQFIDVGIYYEIPLDRE